MHGERETAPHSDKSGIFTIQDHFNLFTRQDGSSPLLLPQTDYFLPVDILKSNLPLFRTFQQPIKLAEDPIANLLYANLKIKKILDDYTKVQKRAIELLNGSIQTAPLGKMNTQLSQNTSKLSIEQEINQLYRSIATLPSYFTIYHAPNLNYMNQAVDIQKDSYADNQIQNQSNSQRTVTSNRMPTELPIGKISGSSITNRIIQGHQNQSLPTNNREAQETATEKADLPWILNLPTIIFNYFFNNKAETLILSFGFLMFINLIFNIRSR